MTKTTTIDAPKLHSGHMEVAVAELIGWRQNTIVPNVSWGLGLIHEADLLVLDKQGRLTEVEIKISKSDLDADFKKPHGHHSAIISRLIYAVPDFLTDYARQNIPDGSGLISVKWDQYLGKYVARWQRMAKHRKHASKPEPKTVLKLASLGCMRIWSLKTALYNR